VTIATRPATHHSALRLPSRASLASTGLMSVRTGGAPGSGTTPSRRPAPQVGALLRPRAPAAPGRSRRAPDDTGCPPATSGAPASETVLRARREPDRTPSPPRGSGPSDRRPWPSPARPPVTRIRSRAARTRPGPAPARAALRSTESFRGRCRLRPAPDGFDQLFQAKRELVDHLDVPQRPIQRAYRAS
jgi:hypothetical protein